MKIKIIIISKKTQTTMTTMDNKLKLSIIIDATKIADSIIDDLPDFCHETDTRKINNQFGLEDSSVYLFDLYDRMSKMVLRYHRKAKINSTTFLNIVATIVLQTFEMMLEEAKAHQICSNSHKYRYNYIPIIEGFVNHLKTINTTGDKTYNEVLRTYDIFRKTRHTNIKNTPILN